MPTPTTASRTHAVQQLAQAGLSLPEPATPIAAYIPTQRIGDQVIVSGQIPVSGGTLIATGIVPTQVSQEEAIQCAQQCILNALASIYAAIGDDEGIVQIIRIGCFVASTPEFGAHPVIANGASELLVQIFGDAGRHARAAVGCSSLPINAPVEIEMTVLVGKLD